jgi:sialate O-acetylesterase
VTIDIGNRDDVHPTSKQEVGRRLARAARATVFGEKISPSGAVPAAARADAHGITVQFTGFEGELVVYNSRDPSAFELCGDEAGSCRFVQAALGADGQVRLPAQADHSGNPAPAATRVRYCWADSPLCNLYDSAGLPVGPFEIAVPDR